MTKRTTQQTAIWAGVVIVLAIGLYYWYREPADTLLLPEGIDPIIDDSYAQATAQSLFDAMNQPGTDEESLEYIYNELLDKNDADLVLIWNAFGSPKYFFTGEAYLGSNQNLGGWLNAEISGDLLEKYRLLFINVAPF